MFVGNLWSIAGIVKQEPNISIKETLDRKKT